MLPVQPLQGASVLGSRVSLVGGKAQESNNEELLFQRLLAESHDVPPLGHSDRRGRPKRDSGASGDVVLSKVGLDK